MYLGAASHVSAAPLAFTWSVTWMSRCIWTADAHPTCSGSGGRLPCFLQVAVIRASARLLLVSTLLAYVAPFRSVPHDALAWEHGAQPASCHLRGQTLTHVRAVRRLGSRRAVRPAPTLPKLRPVRGVVARRDGVLVVLGGNGRRLMRRVRRIRVGLGGGCAHSSRTGAYGTYSRGAPREAANSGNTLHGTHTPAPCCSPCGWHAAGPRK